MILEHALRECRLGTAPALAPPGGIVPDDGSRDLVRDASGFGKVRSRRSYPILKVRSCVSGDQAITDISINSAIYGHSRYFLAAKDLRPCNDPNLLSSGAVAVSSGAVPTGIVLVIQDGTGVDSG